ncbi:Transposon TX1 uncharacterized protein [Nymphaea thermarum]|nr:Transposon TX1 uncharacterized protein [Nymphaea thermarum]
MASVVLASGVSTHPVSPSPSVACTLLFSFATGPPMPPFTPRTSSFAYLLWVSSVSFDSSFSTHLTFLRILLPKLCHGSSHNPAYLPLPPVSPTLHHIPCVDSFSPALRLPPVAALLDAELGISFLDALAALKVSLPQEQLDLLRSSFDAVVAPVSRSSLARLRRELRRIGASAASILSPGAARAAKRASLHVRQLVASPWLLAGNLNCLLSPADSSSPVTSGRSMFAFRSFVDEFGLFDVPSTNGTLTWSNNRNPPILRRLDRIFLSPELFFAFPSSSLVLGPRHLSDHVSGTLGSILSFGGSVMNPLWLPSLIGGLAPSMCLAQEWRIRESIHWQQRSRLGWLAHGDQNSRFFHLAASQRRRQMLLPSMVIGGMVFLGDDILPALSTHFRDFYSKPLRFRAPLPDFHLSSLFVSCVISLERPFLHQEIKNAVWALGSDKAPDIDGFPEFNQATCALVPKRPNPTDVTHFRPISILGTTYKIIAKLLSLRLAPVMPSIINPFQVAFVKGRHLQDAVVLVNEVAHSLYCLRLPLFILKLDIFKVFDSISWEFLSDLLTRLAFGPSFRQWILSLVTGAQLAVSFNGKCGDFFCLECGLRQAQKRGVHGQKSNKEWVTFDVPLAQPAMLHPMRLDVPLAQPAMLDLKRTDMRRLTCASHGKLVPEMLKECVEQSFPDVLGCFKANYKSKNAFGKVSSNPAFMQTINAPPRNVDSEEDEEAIDKNEVN